MRIAQIRKAPEDHDDDDPEGGQLVMEIGDVLTVPEVEEASVKPARKQKKNSRTPAAAPESKSNRGTLMLDATCVPADIKSPTDLHLLHHGREILETIIDTLHQPLVGIMDKPRTYRNQARRAYLNVSKQRQPKGKTIRNAVKKQLGYVGRDLRIIEGLIQHTPLTVLKKSLYHHLLVIQELYRQQREMMERHPPGGASDREHRTAPRSPHRSRQSRSPCGIWSEGGSQSGRRLCMD